MVTAILLSTAIVIAVVMYALCKVSSECSRIEEQESIKWAKKWNEQRAKESNNYKWCDDDCLYCEENQNCKFSEVRL